MSSLRWTLTPFRCKKAFSDFLFYCVVSFGSNDAKAGNALIMRDSPTLL
jgi:hypothetical protein